VANQVWLHAYVLHRRPYRETSYLVDVFTQEWGKVSLVAKGVRNSKTDRKSLLQPFIPVRLQCSGKTDLKNLTQLESNGRLIPLTGNTLFCGLYINELTNRILPAGLASEGLFAAYEQALERLLHPEESVEKILRLYEFSVLEDLGQLADFATESASGEPVDAARMYHYIPDVGVVAEQHNSGLASIPGAALLDLSEQHFSSGALKVAKYINRLSLAPLIGDKPLKSRDLFVSRSSAT